MKTIKLFSVKRIYFLTLYLLFCSFLANGQEVNDMYSDPYSLSLSFSPSQTVANAVTPINYYLKSGKMELKDNTVLITKYGIEVRVHGNTQLTKGTGTFEVQINGTTPSIPNTYRLPIKINKLECELIINVVGDAYTSESGYETTEISTNGNDFERKATISMSVKQGALSATLNNGQLLGGSGGIDIIYAGKLQTFSPGNYNISVIIKGVAGLMSGSYPVALNNVPGVSTIHEVIIKNTITVSSFRCPNIIIDAISGESFSIIKPITLTLSGTVINLSANQLLGESNGIEIRYSGISRAFYPGDNEINVTISGGTSVQPGSYELLLNRINNIIPACNITVNVATGKSIGQFICSNLNLDTYSGDSFSEKKQIELVIESNSVSLDSNCLIGLIQGIQVRYYGPTKTYYPGRYTIDIRVRSDGYLGKGRYTIPLNLISRLSSHGNVNVNVY